MTIGGGGVKNYQKLSDVIFGWPPSWVVESTLRVYVCDKCVVNSKIINKAERQKTKKKCQLLVLSKSTKDWKPECLSFSIDFRSCLVYFSVQKLVSSLFINITNLRKEPKQCHVLFEWPPIYRYLYIISIILKTFFFII